MKKSAEIWDEFSDEGFGPGTDLVFSILAVLIVMLAVVRIPALLIAGETDLSYINREKTAFLDELYSACGASPAPVIPDGEIRITTGACDLRIQDTPETQTIIFNESVLFDFREAVLKPGGVEVLRLLRGAMSRRQGDMVEVQILGHTDNVGGEEQNLQLGYQRSLAVFNLLTNQDDTRIDPLNVLVSLTTYGFYRPISRAGATYSEEQLQTANGDDQSRASNRRIELRITYRKAEGARR